MTQITETYRLKIQVSVFTYFGKTARFDEPQIFWLGYDPCEVPAWKSSEGSAFAFSDENKLITACNVAQWPTGFKPLAHTKMVIVKNIVTRTYQLEEKEIV